MKVGILTFPNSTSFGAALQMYALYRAVEELGAEAEILNYHNAYMKAERHTGRVRGKSSIGGKLYLLLKNAMHCRQISGFRAFEKSLDRYPAKPVSDKHALPGLCERYSHVICGSDQVWNPNITDTDLSYFLDFCDCDTKRISYAPSFGISEFSTEFQTKIKKELLQFKALSAREVEGQELIQALTGTDVPLVTDPTFLLTKAQWTQEERTCTKQKEPYILYYTVKSSKHLLQFARKLAEEKNMKLLVVGGNAVKQLKNRDSRLEYAWDLEPRQWLGLMHHADCVVTNSFHGTAFSLIYEKDFYLELSSETNSRLRQIVRTAAVEDRVVGEGCAAWDSHIDYTRVMEKLEPLKKSSKEYLKAAITDVK